MQPPWKESPWLPRAPECKALGLPRVAQAALCSAGLRAIALMWLSLETSSQGETSISLLWSHFSWWPGQLSLAPMLQSPLPRFGGNIKC